VYTTSLLLYTQSGDAKVSAFSTSSSDTAISVPCNTGNFKIAAYQRNPPVALGLRLLLHVGEFGIQIGMTWYPSPLFSLPWTSLATIVASATFLLAFGHEIREDQLAFLGSLTTSHSGD
jgi:hypothetical protein